MKIIYKDESEINIERISNAIFEQYKYNYKEYNLVIVNTDMFYKLCSECINTPIIVSYWYQQNGFKYGIKIFNSVNFKIIESSNLENEVLFF